MLKVLVALQDPIADRGVRSILDGADDIDAVRYDPMAGDLAAAVQEIHPQVLLLDVQYRRDDARLVPELTDRFQDLRVLIFVDHSADQCGVRYLLAAGGRAKLAPEALPLVDECCLTSLRQRATGCLAHGSSPEAVLTAVRSVARGEIAAAPWLTAVASSMAAGGGGGERAPISPRELEVMALLAEGHSNKQIAKLMEIREQTVKNHVGSLMDKLGVASRLEAGLLAARHHLTLVKHPTGD